MLEIYRKCKVCEIEIEICRKLIGIHFSGRPRYKYVSKKGTNYGNNWFCEKCWNEIKNYETNEEDKKYLKKFEKYTFINDIKNNTKMKKNEHI